MEKIESKQKLILAVLQGEDYADTIDELNRSGFFATVLSSTGGFLKKKSVTVMIGVEESKVSGVLEILKRCAGRRQQMTYSDMSMATGTGVTNPAISMLPVQMHVGGAVVFTMSLDDIQKF